LNEPAGSPQNMHSGPPPVLASIHPVALAVAACIPSNLGVPFTVVLHLLRYRWTGRHDRTWRRFRLGCLRVTSTLRVAWRDRRA
jgi:hypothetical protein